MAKQDQQQVRDLADIVAEDEDGVMSLREAIEATGRRLREETASRNRRPRAATARTPRKSPPPTGRPRPRSSADQSEGPQVTAGG